MTAFLSLNNLSQYLDISCSSNTFFRGLVRPALRITFAEMFPDTYSKFCVHYCDLRIKTPTLCSFNIQLGSPVCVLHLQVSWQIRMGLSCAQGGIYQTPLQEPSEIQLENTILPLLFMKQFQTISAASFLPMLPSAMATLLSASIAYLVQRITNY